MPGQHLRLTTPNGPIHVYTPAGATSSRATVIYVHGYYVDVDQAWTEYRLAEQFDASKIDATFIVPEAPSGNDKPVYWTSLDDLLDTVRASVVLGTGIVAAVGHSGAFRTILEWLGSSALVYIGLIDALYAGYDRFLAWAQDPVHSMTLIGTTDKPSELSLALAQAVGGTVQSGIGSLMPATQAAARVLYVAITSMTHMALVTSGKVIPQLLRCIPTPRRSTSLVSSEGEAALLASGMVALAGAASAVTGLLVKRFR